MGSMQSYAVSGVVALVVAASTLVFVAGHERGWFAWADQAPPHALVSSSLTSTMTLLLIRSSIFLVSLIVIACTIAIEIESQSASVLVYFSFWNYLLFSVYFLGVSVFGWWHEIQRRWIVQPVRFDAVTSGEYSAESDGDSALYGGFQQQPQQQRGSSSRLPSNGAAAAAASAIASSDGEPRRRSIFQGAQGGEVPDDGASRVDVSTRWFVASVASYALWLLLNVTFAMAIFVDVIFWFFLFPVSIVEHNESKLLSFVSLNGHAINVVLLLVEVTLNHLSLRFYPALLSLSLFGLYAIFTWFYYEGTGTWLYGSLFDTTLDWTLATYLLLFASIDVFHLIGYGIWRTKQWLLTKYLGSEAYVPDRRILLDRERYLSFS